MKLIAGLGNPGSEYKKTRHNLGFMVLDLLKNGLREDKKDKVLYYKDQDKIYALPQTYMNRSGEAVQGLMTFFKIKPDDLIVLHDDLDLKLGQIKIKKGGGTGGHNGLKSIDERIGRDYWRIRMGIGRPPLGYDVSSFVLGRFTKEEEEQVAEMLEKTKELLAHEGNFITKL
jgi:PTH1 family peptidyl-tRNA hydrolase